MAKIRDLIQQNDDKKLVLPDFQRDLEWNMEKQKSLLASFFVNLPIGSLLLLEGKKDSFAAREIGVPNMRIEPYDDCLFLLDGQQRLTTLKYTFTDIFNVENWRDRWLQIYSPLRARWFLKVKPSKEQEDIFGYRKLQPTSLCQFEPGDIIDSIISKKVHRTKTDQQYNPGFSPKGEDGKPLKHHKKELIIAKYLAENHIVPLYSMFGGSEHSLHSKVINAIAKNRTIELQAELADISDQAARIAATVNILQPVEPNISEYIENPDTFIDDINSAWSLLYSNWSISLRKQLESILDYEVQLISLPLAEIARAVSIFTSINEGGQKLDNYDLVVAKAAKDNTKESLTMRIRQQVFSNTPLSKGIVDNILNEQSWTPSHMNLVEGSKLCKDFKDQYLNLLSIYSHTSYGDVQSIKVEHTKAKRHLSLTHDQINENSSTVINSLVKAYEFLQYRCGIPSIQNLPYKLMALPIAYLMLDKDIQSESTFNKIEYWYWSSLFGGYYREAQNERCISDLQNLYTWVVSSCENPFESRLDSVLTGSKYSDKETLLLKADVKPAKAIEHGILQYILSTQPRDFLPKNYKTIKLRTWEISRMERLNFTYSEDGNQQTVHHHIRTQVHHILPLNNATSLGQSSKEIRNNPEHILNSPLNLTLISDKANGLLSDLTPDKYIEMITEHAFDNHLLPPADSVKKVNGETDDEYYIRFLTARFNIIRATLINELDNLV